MRFAASFLGCFLAAIAASAAPASDAQPSLAAILSAARTASGAPYRFHVRSQAEETLGARTLAIVTDSQGDLYYIRRCSGEICSGLFFDGARLYDTNFNETALPIQRAEDPRRVTLRAIESYAFTDAGFMASGGSLTLHASRNGERLERITVTAPRGAPLDALIDTATSLVVEVAAADSSGFDVTLGDERRVGNSVTLPFEITTGTDVERFTSRALVSAPLDAPRGLVPNIDGGSTTLTMPQATNLTAPIVQCNIGGVKVPCLLDTGNSAMAMSLDLAEQLHIEAVPHAFEVQGIGSYVTGIVKGPELKIGSATYPSAYYAVLHDMHDYGYDLVLGADLFAHTAVTLNYADRTVTLVAGARGQTPNGVKLAFSGFLPFARVRLDDLDTSLVFDTGDDSVVNLSYAFYQRHPGLFSPTGVAAVGGIGGSSDEVTGVIQSVRVGGFGMSSQRIGATKSLPSSAAGHVGTGLLAHFITTFDYANARVDLVPRPGDSAVSTTSRASR